MPNALSPTDPAPAAPAPNVLQLARDQTATPAAGMAPQSQGPSNVLQGQRGAMPQQQPTLTHAQAVASLRHFHAIANELESLLKNPEIGKSDIKSAIIDATTKLVAGRIITPAEAVTQLGSVPKEPFQQRAWVQQHFTQTMLAENAVLDHYRASPPSSDDAMTSDPDAHLDTMRSVHAAYGGRR